MDMMTELLILQMVARPIEGDEDVATSLIGKKILIICH